MTDHKEVVQEECQTETFSSPRFDVEVKTFPKCRVELTITASKELLKEARQMAIRQISKEISIPGFRKGKAPATIIEKKYPGAIHEQWDKAFADVAFKEAQALTALPILHGNSRVSYQVLELSDENGAIAFQFEREPAVPSIDYNLLTLKDVKEESIDDHKVNETIKSIQMFYARWDQIEDRPVHEGDFVTIDIDDLDQDPPVQAFSNARFQVETGRMAEWMRKLVVGQMKGSSVEGMSEADENESEAVKKEFQPKKVRIHIKTIEHAHLPPLDEEFAKRVGVPNVHALQIQVKNLLIKQAHENWLRDQRDSISDQLLSASPFDIPASMLEREANFRVSQLFKNAAFSKKWKEEMSEEEKEAKKKEITTQAEHAIRLFYAYRKVISDNNIPVSEDEISPNYETLLEMMFADPARANYHSQSKDQQAIEFSRFLMSKAQDFIIEKIQSGNQ